MKRGFIGNIIIILLGLFALALIFGVDIVGFLKNPQISAFTEAIWRVVLGFVGLVLAFFDIVFAFMRDRL